jgi:cyanophycinase-like exopeptidase
MSVVKGTVALIGSGELTGTMVETHKSLLSRVEPGAKTLFLDTPAGFQENVDLIAARAVDYFKRQVGHAMEVASFKSAEESMKDGAQKTYQLLSEAGYVLVGPGSPTYMVSQLKDTPVPALLGAMVTRGGCLTAASAAALTAGSHTLPVYEIYKVGQELHWVEGLNFLGHLGFEVVVIPHWNNAEGGNHDTRYCYMGEKRFHALEESLPANTTIIGLDEHTACVLDFSTRLASIEGIGNVIIRRGGLEKSFTRGVVIPFEEMLGAVSGANVKVESNNKDAADGATSGAEKKNPFWERMHRVDSGFARALTSNDAAAMTTQLLEADRLLWQAQLDLESPEFVSQGRELFREMIVLAGTGLDRTAVEIPRRFNLLVNELVELRESCRRLKMWPEADRIRELLNKANVVLEDTEAGPRWHV